MWSEAALTLVLLLAGIQDWRSREVSNWLSIPLWLAGLAGMLWRLVFHLDELALGILLVFLLLTAAALLGWMGGADYKALVGLFGLWPLGGLAALLGCGLWGGLAVLLSRDRRAAFPGVSAMALSAALTFLAQVIYNAAELT